MKNIKKFIISALSMCVLVLTLTSCNLSIKKAIDNNNTTETDEYVPNIVVNPSEGEYNVPSPSVAGDYTVTFICNNGYAYQAKTDSENKVLEPDAPTKICATFKGWYKNSDCTSLFTFKNAITSDITLYAKWDINYLDLYNKLQTEVILSNLRLQVENYDITGFNHKTGQSYTMGSGVIFYEANGYYYALTNNHVVYKKAKYQDLTVYDAYQNPYPFEVMGSLNTYDLAIIRFQKSTKLVKCEMADYTINANELVFAIGEPNGLSNTITNGYVITTKPFEPASETIDISNVTFNVYRSSVLIQSGSSGGALYDSNLKLVGVNFASSYESSTGEFKYSYAIPIDKVKEFIKLIMQVNI